MTGVCSGTLARTTSTKSGLRSNLCCAGLGAPTGTLIAPSGCPRLELLLGAHVDVHGAFLVLQRLVGLFHVDPFRSHGRLFPPSRRIVPPQVRHFAVPRSGANDRWLRPVRDRAAGSPS